MSENITISTKLHLTNKWDANEVIAVYKIWCCQLNIFKYMIIQLFKHMVITIYVRLTSTHTDNTLPYTQKCARWFYTFKHNLYLSKIKINNFLMSLLWFTYQYNYWNKFHDPISASKLHRLNVSISNVVGSSSSYLQHLYIINKLHPKVI